MMDVTADEPAQLQGEDVPNSGWEYPFNATYQASIVSLMSFKHGS
jgi:hypothetical protein